MSLFSNWRRAARAGNPSGRSRYKQRPISRAVFEALEQRQLLSGLTVDTINDAGVSLLWDSPAPEDAVTGFILQSSTDSATWSQIATPAGDDTSAWVDSTFAPTTTYYFRIAAVNESGQLPWSNPPASVTTLAVPSAPDTLVVSAIDSGDHADVAFADNATNEDGFVLEWSLADSPFAADGSACAPANTGTGTVSFIGAGSFVPDTDYYFRVCAYNSFTSSAWSSIAGPITTADYPDAPSDLEATTISTSEIDLVWTDNSDNETGFYLWRSDDGETWTACPDTITASPYSDTSLPAGMTYYYRVAAYSDDGTLDYAYTQAATVPDAPANVAATVVSASEIDLAWDTPTGNSSLLYCVYGDTSSAGFTPSTGNLLSSDVVDPNFAAFGLDPSTTYYFKVIASDDFGDTSAASDAASDTTLDAPPAPTDLEATDETCDCITLSWSESATDETGLELQYSTNGGTSFDPIAYLDPDTTSYTVPWLDANTTYTFRIQTTRDDADSAWSNTGDGKTLVAPPDAPQSLSLSAYSQTQIQLVWPAIQDAADYEIQVSDRRRDVRRRGGRRHYDRIRLYYGHRDMRRRSALLLPRYRQQRRRRFRPVAHGLWRMLSSHPSRPGCCGQRHPWRHAHLDQPLIGGAGVHGARGAGRRSEQHAVLVVRQQVCHHRQRRELRR